MKSGKLNAAIGTIAGDDTVLVVAKLANGGAALSKEIQKLMGGK
jgi:transcriptional regulator of arginine metabolism